MGDRDSREVRGQKRHTNVSQYIVGHVVLYNMTSFSSIDERIGKRMSTPTHD